MKYPHAVPERRPNLWFSLLGLIAYGVGFTVVLIVALALLLSLQPPPVQP